MRKILKMNKNNEPLISVIVPVYNGADRLSVCLKSISRQTYKNFEMIIIDDGSTDDTLAICKCWASLDKRLLRLEILELLNHKVNTFILWILMIG